LRRPRGSRRSHGTTLPLAVVLAATLFFPSGVAAGARDPASVAADPGGLLAPPPGPTAGGRSPGKAPSGPGPAGPDGRPRTEPGAGSATSPPSPVGASSERRAYARGVVLVGFRPGTAASARAAAHRAVHATRAAPLSPLSRDTEKLTLAKGTTVAAAIKALRHNPNIRFAEPDYIVSVDATSNDPLVTDGTLWGMLSGGSAPANAFGSGAADAWAAGVTGSRSVVVGVVDEGIQWDHPDLAPNVWTNPWEIAGNGIDDDGNGYVDDIHGWDFKNDDASVYDGPATDDHATHVAGTIGGVGGNGTGVAGVNWAITMISAKFLEGSGETSDAIAALDYLTDLKIRHGLDIVATNNSWGGGAEDLALTDAINRGGDAGILFVAAAGNAGSDIDAAPSWPASTTCTTRFDTGAPRGWDCLVSVAAIDASGALAGFSNRGAISVDLGAPGVNVTSTYPPDSYASFNGTSMATPHVTGALALLASCNASLDAEGLRGDLLGAVTATPALSGVTVSGGRLNVAGMTSFCDASGPPTALLISPTGYVTGSSFQTRIWFNRSVSGLATGDFTIGGTSAGWSASVVNGSGIGPYTLTVSTASATDGTVVVTLKANSVSDGTQTGPAGPTAAPSVRIDRTAPVIGTPVVTPSTVSRNGGARITASASDASAIAAAAYRVDGGAWQGMGPVDGTFGDSGESLAATLGGSVVQVSSGTDFTCALLADGHVRCWGDNSWNQLGSGTTAARSNVPIEIVGLANVVSISAGHQHACAVISDGSVRCWGFNFYGQLGQAPGFPWSIPTPVTVAGLSNAVAVSGGTYFTCALIADGHVRCWGFNHGEIGDGTLGDRPSAVQVVGIDTAVAIGASSNSACALLANGTIECWGNGYAGVLGNGPTDGHLRPEPVTGITTATSLGLSVGGHHACAVLADGTIRCWGANDSGQLGDGTTTDANEPVAVPGITTAVRVSVGYDFSCSLLADGTVRCWGANAWGQLGDGSGAGSLTPVTVSAVTDATSLSANGAHGCIVDVGAAARCWGLNYSGQQGDGTNVDRPIAGYVSGLAGPLSVGGHTVCVRATDGPGNSSSGAACASLAVVADTTPPTAAIGGPAGPAAAATIWFGIGFSESTSGLSVADLSRTGTAAGCSIGALVAGGGRIRVPLTGCGEGTVALRVAAGSVTDGNGNPGPAALISSAAVTIDRTAPTVDPPSLAPPVPTPGQAVGVSAGATDSSGIADGSMSVDSGPWVPAAAGDGTFGGTSETITSVANVIGDAVSISTGATFSCAVLGDGTVRCWGENGRRQLGDGTTINRTAPVQVLGVGDAVAVSAGGNHACALRVTGEIVCWGANDSGQLGIGWSDFYGGSDPVAVNGIADAVAISAGGMHTCAIVTGGVIRCWGNNNFGQIGDGTQTFRTTPVDVPGLGPATAISTGYQMTCAVLANGTGRCWGDGLLGDGVDFWTRQWSTVPVVVSGLAGATAITVGYSTACALVAGGAVRCWGRGEFGQLGNGDTNWTTVPVATSGISGATAIGGGAFHTCAVLADGTARCWGRNESGELGDGTTTNRPTPVAVGGLTGAAALDGGGMFSDVGHAVFHSCARVADGTVRCWGANGTGELGDGTTADRSVAGRVVGIEPALAVGAHEICVRAGDVAGNISSSASCDTLTVAPDTAPPSAQITAPASPTRSAGATFQLAFSEPVTGLTTADLGVSGTATGCVIGAPVITSPTHALVTLTGCTDGTVTLTLAAGAVTDGAANPGPVAPVSAGPLTFDRTPAAATVGSPASPTASSTVTFSLTFDEPVTGLTAADLALNGGAPDCQINAPVGSGASYSVAVTGCGTGKVGLAIFAGTVLDAAANPSPTVEVAGSLVTVDRLAPTVSTPGVRARIGGSTNGVTIPYELTWTGADAGTGVVRYEVRRSVNGGTPVVMTTNAHAPFAIGLASGTRYRFDVRAIDGVGHASAWRASATVTPGLVQQTSTAVRYGGAWSTAWSTSYSGGSARASSTAGAAASYTFTGRGIALVTTRAATRGRVKIYIDGVYITRLDLLSATVQFRAIAWQRTWTASGTHTIRLVLEGTVGRPRFDLDALAVLH
jgi:alpha-tubulin suppressor-like RCC1 family protein/subtilisin family serine protease